MVTHHLPTVGQSPQAHGRRGHGKAIGIAVAAVALVVVSSVALWQIRAGNEGAPVAAPATTSEERAAIVAADGTAGYLGGLAERNLQQERAGTVPPDQDRTTCGTAIPQGPC